MKKIISLLLTVLVLIGLTGCSGKPLRSIRATGHEFNRTLMIPLEEVPIEALEMQADSVDCRTALKNFFSENFSDEDTAFLADVTGDYIPELIVVENGEPNPEFAGETHENMLAGYVFAVTGDGEVICIETKRGGTVHTADFFSWYITEGESDGTYKLVEENHSMWHGFGTLETVIYDLYNNEKRILDTLSFTDGETNTNISDYRAAVTNVIGYSWEIYSNCERSNAYANVLEEGEFEILKHGFVDKKYDVPEEEPKHKMGKYDGRYGGNEWYSIIELKPGHKFVLDTSFEQSTNIPPGRYEGIYRYETVTDTCDGSKYDYIVFYLDGKEYERFWTSVTEPMYDQSGSFWNQWINYYYIGE